MRRHGPSAIQREIRQQQPFRSASQEAVLSLWRTADRLRTHFSGVVEPAGVTLQQYNVLRILRGAGPAGLPTLEVADRMVEHAPGITRMIDRLAAKGWVERCRTSADRRQVHCRITPAGLALLERLDGPMHDADDRVLATLSAAELNQLIALLDRARAGLAGEARAP